MRTLLNALIVFICGLIALLASLFATFALLVAITHSSAPGPLAGAGLIVIAMMMWPLHLFVALVAMFATFLWRQAREDRMADEALDRAFRESE